MNEKRYREYTPEFKKQALDLLKQSGKSASELERELGITPGLLGKWRARYRVVEREGTDAQIVPSEMEAAKAEIRRLQRALANAEEEREILKKALNIFSRKSG